MPAIDRWVDQPRHRVAPARVPRSSRAAALGFAINFSGQSLNDESFPEFLLERIAGSGLDPELFCFELTENATMASIAARRGAHAPPAPARLRRGAG